MVNPSGVRDITVPDLGDVSIRLSLLCDQPAVRPLGRGQAGLVTESAKASAADGGDVVSHGETCSTGVGTAEPILRR